MPVHYSEIVLVVFLLFLLLSVVCVRAVFAHVVLLYEQGIHLGLGVQCERNECHLCALFHNLGVIYGI